MTKEQSSENDGHLDTKDQNVSGQKENMDDQMDVAAGVSASIDGHNNLPIDRGWAWIILAAGWVNVFLTIGMYKVCGILFVEIQSKYGSSSSVTSLIPSLINVAFSISALLVNTVALTYISVRQSVIAGAVVLFVTLVLSAFVTSIEMIILLQGVVIGISQGLILPPTFSLLAQYFEKRRGLSNCTLLTGGCIGALTFSVVVRKLVTFYSLSGTFLILGALSLHVAVAGAGMRPFESYIIARKRIRPEEEPLKLTQDKKSNHYLNAELSNDLENDPVNNDQVNKSIIELNNGDECKHHAQITDSDQHLVNTKDELINSELVRSVAVMNARRRTVSEAENTSIFSSGSSMNLTPSLGRYASNQFSISTSVLDLCEKPALGTYTSSATQNRDENNASTSCGCVSLVCGKVKGAIDCRVMKRATFLFYLPIAGMLCSGCSMIQTFIPPHAKDIGLSNERSDFLITLISSLEIFAVLGWGVIADRNWIKKSNIIASSALVMGILTYFIPFFNTSETMVFYCVVYGIIGRLYFPFFPVVLVEVFGKDNLRSALGITFLFHSAFMAIALPVAGVLRDISGTYFHSFQLIATCLVLGGLGMSCLPLVEKCELNWRQKKSNTSENQTINVKAL